MLIAFDYYQRTIMSAGNHDQKEVAQQTPPNHGNNSSDWLNSPSTAFQNQLSKWSNKYERAGGDFDSAQAVTSNKSNRDIGGLLVAAGGLLAGGLIVGRAVYKKCPPNKLLVIYGRNLSLKRGTTSGTRIVKEGGATVFPVLQDYRYMNLEPLTMEMQLKGALSLEKIRVGAKCLYDCNLCR